MKKDWLYDVFVAHRGLHDSEKGIVENTLPAFQAAIDAGYNIELDVQLTKDGKLVVYHDDNFKRVCGIEADVDSFDYDYIKKNVRFLANPDSSVYVPLFSEVAALCEGKTGLMIEIKKKSDGFYDYKVEEALLKELKKLQRRFHSQIVQSLFSRFFPYSSALVSSRIFVQ